MLFYFAFTLFVSASLLFLVQPMVGKMILPRLGGTPAVWNTCMVFFQGVLLIGYAYTHAVSGWPRRKQLYLQMVILALPFLVLPFTLGSWIPPEESNPSLSVLWLLLGMVGLPFFVVSTTAPLLQKWFASTGHPASKDPYFLYGASNLGSMLALMAYPLLVEPQYSLGGQTWIWTAGYGLFVALVLGCIAILWRTEEKSLIQAQAAMEAPPAFEAVTSTSEHVQRRTGKKLEYANSIPAEPKPEPSVEDDQASKPMTWGRRLRWVGLAAVPSSLMLGVTTYMTTDIAAIPFFWVLPLALYLLTFIFVFARWPVVWTGWPHTAVIYVQPFLLMALVLIMVNSLDFDAFSDCFLGISGTFLVMGVHVLSFFFTTLMCHGELARDRPTPAHLTEFYLCMSLGGVLGGMFNALLAPVLPFFQFGVIEYYIAFVLACLLAPKISPGKSWLWTGLDLGVAIALGVFALWCYQGIGRGVNIPDFPTLMGISTVLAKGMVIVLIYLLFTRPLAFGLSLAAVLLVFGIQERGYYNYVFEGRSFFGFVRVREEPHKDKTYHTLIHGGINHGWQDISPERRRNPITYFHPTGGIGQIFEKFKWADQRMPASLVGLGASPLDPWGALVALHSEPPFGVLGMGIGTLAAHVRPLQQMTFFEIDPIIRGLSFPGEGKEPFFWYAQDAVDRGGVVDVVMGDGRLTLQKARAEKYYHILVMDAFSSDAIPVHLLTKEAIEMYLSRLADGGVLIFNTTNRYVDITGVLADLAKELDVDAYGYGDYGDGETKFGSDWVVFQRRHIDPKGPTYNGGPLMRDRVKVGEEEGSWKPPVPLGRPVWSDKYSNLLGVVKWK